MIVPITIFLWLFFTVVAFYTVLIILGFLVKLVGYPIRLFWESILNLT